MCSLFVTCNLSDLANSNILIHFLCYRQPFFLLSEVWSALATRILTVTFAVRHSRIIVVRKSLVRLGLYHWLINTLIDSWSHVRCIRCDWKVFRPLDRWLMFHNTFLKEALARSSDPAICGARWKVLCFVSFNSVISIRRRREVLGCSRLKLDLNRLLVLLVAWHTLK